jgi:hypothetical protein
MDFIFFLPRRNYFFSATNLVHYLETINSNVLASLTTGIQLLENLKSNSKDTKENIALGIDSKKTKPTKKREVHNTYNEEEGIV